MHAPAPLAAQGAAGSADAAASPAPRITPTASLRLRAEHWDWFDAGPDGRYSFVGVHARLGATGTHGRLRWQAELALPALLGLPADAVRPAPAGALGLGGSYAAANGGRRDVAGLFVKQASLRVGGLRIGRFEFSDGAERVPADPTLAAVRRERVAQRLIGPFGFTHGQRSVDGLQWSATRGAGQWTVAALRPTRGVFDVDGAGSMPVDLGYVAWSRDLRPRGAPADLRLFGLWTNDRRGTVPVDNRPAAQRAAAPRGIEVATLGAHWIQHRPGEVLDADLLLWGAAQAGRWGGLRHRAGALAVEAALRLPRLHGGPELRLGASQASGDGDAADARHGTFFQVLPTPRQYAPFPYHDLQNSAEGFVQLSWRPHAALTLRASARRLALAQRDDLWYLGGGAFDRLSFGYVGRPSGGHAALGHTLDATLEWRVTPTATLSTYAARASGGAAMRATYADLRPATLLFTELTLRR